MCVCMYVHEYVYDVCIALLALKEELVCVYTCVHVYIHVCMYAYAILERGGGKCVYVCMYTCTCMYIYIYIHAYHTHIR
jgi:hypothetical protein